MDPIIAHDELPQEFTPALPCFHFGSFELPLNGEQRVLRQFTASPPLPAAESFTSPAPQAFNLSASCVVPLRTGRNYTRGGPGLYFLAENRRLRKSAGCDVTKG